MAFARIRPAHRKERLSFKAAQQMMGFTLSAAAMLVSLSVDASGLTGSQTEQARILSLSTQWLRPRTLTQPHPLGLQTLSIEKQERKNQHTARWVNVYQYHYTLNSARLLTIDLESNVVTKQSPINTVHLPLNDAEIEYAKTLLSKDNELLEQLRSEQIRRSASAFGTLSELDVKASIYEPLDTTNTCYKQRCALVSLFDETRTVFTIEPIVNLTALKVHTLESQ